MLSGVLCRLIALLLGDCWFPCVQPIVLQLLSQVLWKQKVSLRQDESAIRLSFFSMGVTAAILKEVGTVDVENERLMIRVITGKSIDR